MINKDLTLPKGDVPEYTNNPTANNDTDSNVHIANREYSRFDPYYYLSYKSPVADNDSWEDINFDKLDEIVEDVVNNGFPQNDISDTVKKNDNIKKSTLKNVSDAEIRVYGTKLISSLKEKGTDLDKIAILNTMAMNLGLDKDEISDIVDNILSSNENNYINEENSELVGRTAKVPENILKHLKDIFNNSSKKKFISNILSEPTINYRNLKRKLNLLDNADEKQFNDMGGKILKDFIEDTLDLWRSGSKSRKKSVSRVMDNAYNKSSNKTIPSIPKINENNERHPIMDNPNFIGFFDNDRNCIDEVPLTKLFNMLDGNYGLYKTKIKRELVRRKPMDKQSVYRIFKDLNVKAMKRTDNGKYACLYPSLHTYIDDYCILEDNDQIEMVEI